MYTFIYFLLHIFLCLVTQLLGQFTTYKYFSLQDILTTTYGSTFRFPHEVINRLTTEETTYVTHCWRLAKSNKAGGAIYNNREFGFSASPMDFLTLFPEACIIDTVCLKYNFIIIVIFFWTMHLHLSHEYVDN